MVYFKCNVGEKMKEKAQDRKNKIATLVILLVLLIVIIALSYAAFRFFGEGQKPNVITLGNLEELEEVILTSNPMMKEIDLRSCCKNLKDFRAHMCHPTDFSVNVSGAKNLTYFAAQQNGWTSLDITGCTALEKLLINSDSEDDASVDDTSTSTLEDIIGLDASVQKRLTELFIPTSAVNGDNIKKFYQDCKAEGRNLLMMHGHSLIKPETDPDNMYNDNTYDHE